MNLIIRKFFFCYMLLAVFLINMPSVANAQIVPPSADISRIGKEEKDFIFDNPKFSKDNSVENKEGSIQVKPENAASIKFVLSKLIVKNISVYKDDEIAVIWNDYIGKEVSLDVIYDIALKITNKYRQDGYFLSKAFVPAQTIDEGIVIIDVVEGIVGRIDFIGDMPENGGPMCEFYKNIDNGKPLNINQLERRLLITEDLSRGKYKAILNAMDKEIKRCEGDIVVVIKGEKEQSSDKVRKYISFDNSGSRYVGPYILTGQIDVFNVFNEFDKTSILIKGTPDAEELNGASIEHSTPINYDGLNLVVNASYSIGNPGYLLTSSEIESKTISFSTDLLWKVLRSRNKNINISAGVELSNSKTDALGTLLSDDNVRNVRLRAHYDAIDSYNGMTTFDGSIKQGLNLLGASRTGDANLSRNSAESDYTIIEASAYRLQNINNDFNLMLGFSGQFTENPLLSSLQYGYGGMTFGRAYDSSEVVGDKGISAMVEVRYNVKTGSDDYKIQPFAFYDIGKAWDIANDTTASGASVGLGTRFKYKTVTNASITAAKPLTKSMSDPQFGMSKNGPKFLFSIAHSF